MSSESGVPFTDDLSEGQRRDIVHVKSLVEQLDEVNTIVCDKGYDSEPFRTFVKEHTGETVIAKRNYGPDIDKVTMDCVYTSIATGLKMPLRELSIIALFQLDMTSYKGIMPALYRWHSC